MADRPLVPKHEYWLCEGAALAVWIALGLRAALNYLTTRHLGLLDSQLLAVCLLVASLYLAGSLVPRRYGMILLLPLGGLSWLAAVTMVPRHWWWSASILLRAEQPWWALTTGGVLLLGALAIRLFSRQRDLGAIKGLGYRRILEWAEERPLCSRLLARRVLQGLGYRRD